MILHAVYHRGFKYSFTSTLQDAPIPFFIRKTSMDWINVGPMDC